MSQIKNILIISFIGISTLTLGQDAHYWTEQFGNKSMLLNGTVNASVKDLGLVFYNPGRLAQIENPAFVISAKVYELSKTVVEDGLGKGRDLKESKFGGVPNLVAGTFKIKKLKNHHFAYSFLTRFRSDASFSTTIRAVDGDPILEENYSAFSGKINFNNNLNEEWFGLTWSYSTNEKISFGLSTFAFRRNKNNQLGLQLQGLNSSNKVSTLFKNRQLSYQAYGLLWKGGVAINLKNINIGLTVTTPKIKLFGSGSSVYEDFLSGIDSVSNGNSLDAYIENSQQNLEVNYKSSWAVGIGVGIKLSKGTIHLSGEWYNKVKDHVLMQSDQFIGQQPKDTINFVLIDKLKTVINFGIGYEHHFNKKISAYGSFATDFSSVASDASLLFQFDDIVRHSKFDGDVYHFGGGIALNMPWAELTLGATYATSERDIPRPLNIDGDDKIINSEAFSKLKYSQWRFIVGFSFPFAANISEKFNTP